MSTAFSLSLRLAPGALRRGLLAGVAWGVVTGGGLAAINAFSCGVLCVEDAAIAIGISIVAGCGTIGPLAGCASRV